ncbi:hypothetical protein [uncultured Thiothrix sp.]|uniref:hypothetical protein n=1 Tax=uncultured Thiothrix sp. TaxID=223185 RepID=UPI00262301EE|nr:hypothetical protein [uncultured Thiothrix sp.]HMT93602.1 hypothetical protein [Thiolinea sp.]
MQAPTNYNTLKQRHLLFGSREFIIKAPESLLVRERSIGRLHETQIPLSVLDPSPTYSASFSIKWLFHSLFIGALAGFVFYWAVLKDMLALYILAGILAATTLVLGYRFFLYTTRLVIFRHLHTRENFLYIWQNRPQRKKVQDFVQTLSLLIQEQQQAKPHLPTLLTANTPASTTNPSPVLPVDI